MKQLSHNSPSPWHFQKVVCVFCAFNITGDIKSLVQISILLNKSKLVEIWTKCFISRAILKAQKRQTTFWKWQDYGNFVIIISRNLVLKLGWQINAANYITNQDDIQVILHTVMFRGTPCMFWNRKTTFYFSLYSVYWVKLEAKDMARFRKTCFNYP